ncbi:zinc-binding alcohol dehydrogenase family protein [Alteromonas sp. MMG017]|uniref:zinc-binding alcohol dehydrogenase family protein n=1 Tax=Alteromonas sp. MMG017 TaxID=2822692 RepID=UPI001B3A6CA9|nr:zinc-binding alcohol dehydrogenase family protein [Alteromonas sp. MMG017]MBQ4828501.1 zinc-binding alcohol dehydrogenase family protein [Alteromonas sp. MMG017]
MKTIVCIEPGILEKRDVEKPSPSAGEVLVKIKSIGICGTDIHAYAGNQPFFEYPRVLGHELSGTIVSLGEGVELPVGSSVYIIPYLHCGDCIACNNGKPNCCTNIEVLGVHRDGGMCEYLSVPASAVVISDGLSFNDMAIIECLAIGAHAVRRAKLTKDDTVLVQGAGPIGLSTAQFAKVAGAKVFVSDIKKDKLTFCKEEYNLDAVVDASGDVNAQLAALTNGQYPTVIMDCTGNVNAMQSTFTNLAHGGKIVFISVIKKDICFNDPEFHKRETTLLGSRNATLEDFELVVNCLKEGSVVSRSLVTHTGKFSEVLDTFESWTKPETGVIKAVVEMD